MQVPLAFSTLGYSGPLCHCGGFHSATTQIKPEREKHEKLKLQARRGGDALFTVCLVFFLSCLTIVWTLSWFMGLWQHQYKDIRVQFTICWPKHHQHSCLKDKSTLLWRGSFIIYDTLYLSGGQAIRWHCYIKVQWDMIKWLVANISTVHPDYIIEQLIKIESEYALKCDINPSLHRKPVGTPKVSILGQSWTINLVNSVIISERNDR